MKQLGGRTHTRTGSDVAPPRRKRTLHRAIAAWIAEYDRRIRELTPSPSRGTGLPEILQRSCKLLDEIFRAAMKNGLEPKLESPRRFQFILEDVLINCELRETKTRVRKSTRHGERHSFEGSGKLVFIIQHPVLREEQIQVEWSEKTLGPLENQVSGIVAALLQAGPALARKRNETEVRRSAWHAERLEYQREEELLRRDRAHLKALIAIAERHRTAVVLRRLLTAMDRRLTDTESIVGDRSVGAWMDWARQQLDEFDPMARDIRAVFEQVAKAAES